MEFVFFTREGLAFVFQMEIKLLDFTWMIFEICLVHPNCFNRHAEVHHFLLIDLRRRVEIRIKFNHALCLCFPWVHGRVFPDLWLDTPYEVNVNFGVLPKLLFPPIKRLLNRMGLLQYRIGLTWGRQSCKRPYVDSEKCETKNDNDQSAFKDDFAQSLPEYRL